jgi:tetratricopeptide (TPR) repeat protein
LFQSVGELFLTRFHDRAAGSKGGSRPDLYRFLLKYSIDPEFRLAVEGEMGADLARAEGREELGFVLALEMILSRSGHRLFEDIISKQRLEELEGTYPEVFGTAPREVRTAKELLQMACSLSPDHEVSELAMALDQVFPGGVEAEDVLRAMRRHAGLLNADEAWMRDLEGFHEALSKDLDKLLTALGERAEVDRFRAKGLLGRGREAEMIFCVATQAVALRWFESLDGRVGERVLQSSVELSCAEGAISEGVRLRRLWSESDAEAARELMAAGEALRQYGQGAAAIGLYGAILRMGDLPGRSKAELHNRMAVIHREQGRWHEALLEFQEASILWEEAGARWEEAVTASLVAEAYISLGKKERGLKYLLQAFELMKGLEEEDERMAKGYFYISACANGLGRLDLERKALSAGIRHAQRLEDGEMLLEFNARLLALPK